MSVQCKSAKGPEPFSYSAPPPAYDSYESYSSSSSAYNHYDAPAQYYQPSTTEYTPRSYQQQQQQQSTVTGPLPAPIVIPQQRPGSKDRGFMAAYAPSLEASGIDQRMFLQFIDDCNTAFQGNKYLAGVQVAAMGAGFAPSIIAMAVTTAVQYGAGMANKAHVRNKTNTILDKYNDEVFRPRGLYCMIMKYDPETEEEQQQLQQRESPLRGLGAMVSSSSGSGGSKWTRNPISGKTQGANALPTNVAPLVYMDNRRQHRDYLSGSGSGSDSSSETSQPQKASGKQKVKKAFDSFNDYLDRRARARYAAENAGDILTTPSTSSFTNRYLDPNHAATNSGLIGLISGGTINSDPEARKRSKERRIENEERRVLDEYHSRMDQIRNQRQSPRETDRQLRRCEEDYAPRLRVYSDQRRELEGGKRHIKKDILYLTIVNMPSDGEMAVASAQLSQGQGAVALTHC